MTLHFIRIAAGAIALVGSAGAPAAAEPVDEVIAAERAFAAETRRRGFREGFLAWIAPDGFLFQPGPVPARPGLEAIPADAPPPPGPPLFWWPQFAGAALSGDLGFTSGGATIPVRYFTVWQRQDDGSWKWIYDGGPRLSAPLPGGEGDPVIRLPRATASAGSAEAALAEVGPLEMEVARLAVTDAANARTAWLAPEALVAGSAGASYPGREHHAAELARQPARQAMRPLGGIASRAGDLAFTWGESRWTADGADRWGHYARIWQKRSEGWRIVADVLVPAPGAPPSL
jgi:hypothetical protein